MGQSTVRLGARARDNSIVVGGAEAVVGEGRGYDMMVEGSGSQIVVLCRGCSGAQTMVL